MQKEPNFLKKIDNSKKLSVFARAEKYHAAIDRFQKKHGRKPDSKETHAIKKRVGFIVLRYKGKCPICSTPGGFYDEPERKAPALIVAAKQAVLAWLRPIDSLKQVLSAHSNAVPCYCGVSDAPIIVCPICDAACGMMPVDPAERVRCSNCGATV